MDKQPEHCCWERSELMDNLKIYITTDVNILEIDDIFA